MVSAATRKSRECTLEKQKIAPGIERAWLASASVMFKNMLWRISHETWSLHPRGARGSLSMRCPWFTVSSSFKNNPCSVPTPRTPHWPHIAMLWSCEVVSLILFFCKTMFFWCSTYMFQKVGQVMFYSLNRFTFVGTCIISFYECDRCEVRLFLGRKGTFLRLIQSVYFCMEELKLAEDGRQWWEWRCLDGELSHEGSLQTGWYPQGNISNQN